MNKKTTFLAILLTIAPIFVSAAPEYQHRLASVVLDAENASYMVKTINELVYVTTFDYKTPTETCKFLQSKGVDAVRVTNYSKDIASTTDC